jgi:putative acetyltransferase
VASFGIGVTDAYQGQGVGKLLTGAMMDLADNWLGLARLELTVFTDNTKAKALYEQFGFVLEGTMRGYALRRGWYSDTYCMARLNPRFSGMLQNK